VQEFQRSVSGHQGKTYSSSSGGGGGHAGINRD
jgi:hypothetical protein